MSSFFFQELQLITAFPANISCFPRRLADVFSVTVFLLPRCLQDVFKMSSRRLQDMFAMPLPKTSSRRLQEVFTKKSCNYVLEASSRRLEDVLKDKKKFYAEDVFKTSSRRIQYVFTKTNVCSVNFNWRFLHELKHKVKLCVGFCIFGSVSFLLSLFNKMHQIFDCITS